MKKPKGGFDSTREHFGLTPASSHPSLRAADKAHGMGGPNNTLKGVGLGMASPTPASKTRGAKPHG